MAMLYNQGVSFSIHKPQAVRLQVKASAQWYSMNA